LNRLIAQESEIICDSFLNTTGVLHKDDSEYSQCLNNSFKINSCMANNRNEICIANENGTIYENDINISTSYKNDEYLQLNKTDSEQSCESISFDSISNVSEFANAITDYDSFEAIPNGAENANAMTDNDFKHRLAVWATEHQITHVALRALIQTLKQHSCFSNLSIDARSLVKTPRRLDIRMVTPGTYYHFGLLHSVLHVLTSIKDYTDCVRIIVNVDGLPISKSSSQQFWPILGSVIPYDYVFLIGLYYGNEKPENANDFLKEFVDEMKDLCENGINFNGRNVQCRLEALICDTPAKSFVLCVKGHSGYSSCTKCQTEGEYIGNRICFPQIDAPPRTDDNFVQKIDDNYHKPDITCSLLKVPHFKPVTNVPLDYMHLICLGIVRKLIYLWFDGELHYRLQSKAVEIISTRLLTQLKPSIPVEFARKPRPMNCVKLWKATEYRLILLYTGPLAFKSILQKNVYTNFMVLHVIVRILSSQDLNEYLSYAQDLILFFIKTFMRLYGIQNMSHNVHSLIHLVDDVKKYGPLDKFSAFKFENYMQILKKYVRKADKPLQQVVRRCIEKEMNSDLSSTILSQSVVTNPIVTSLHHDGPLLFNCNNPQYKIIKYKGMTLKAGTVADSCCGLNCNAIVVIKNIAYCTKRNIPVIIGYEFLEKKNLFHIPCPSSILGIYIVHLYSALKCWPLKDVIKKYVQLPYSENKYVVFPLIHM